MFKYLALLFQSDKRIRSDLSELLPYVYEVKYTHAEIDHEDPNPETTEVGDDGSGP